ncbi:glycosyltransferase [Pseudoalteromonas sp. SK20]|uniref:glycosyltransferase family 2 protein n=1 Tax=Pseudoalteromonas sp. SK20 TaxID=1938367 RepID=UPI0009773CC6|nr:glycosyltransferase [Pseudoalteromonas sp. SK20]
MTKKQPLVSIVIPCYNHEKYVEETIQSVINQDYQNIELIVIDDGSVDRSVELIQKMKLACEERFTRFELRHRANKGLCNTLNEALEWCQGEFFAPVASDDILVKYKTRVQVDYLQKNPQSLGVFGGIKQIDNDVSIEKVRPSAKYRFNDVFLHKHVLPAPTQLLRLSKVKKVGGYRANLIIEDWSMWLFLTELGGTLDYLNMIFTIYRRHGDNLSGKHDLMAKGRRQITDLYSSHCLYKSAYSRSLLIYAHDIQTISNFRAIKIALDCIRNYPLCVFSKSFIWLCTKVLICK